jgi:hypothetical protein
MNSVKCFECGLVNWSGEIECKRCRALLTVQEIKAQQLIHITSEPQPFFTRGLQLLTAFMVVAIVLVVISRMFDFDKETAALVALPFVIVGFLLLAVTHIWLLVRIFEQSIGWGLGSLFVPFVGLIAVFMFWEHTKRSFVGQFMCSGIIIVSFLMLPSAG